MTTGRYLRITELDFERIKTNFKEFLKAQDTFNDYNFNGSGLDVLLDVFAYDTHYNAFYLNAAVNESFLSTASKRKNITKRARPYGYVPRSVTGAETTVDLAITVPLSTLIGAFGGTDYGIVQLSKNNRFTTTIDGTSYVFVNQSAVTLTQESSTSFSASNIPIRQGIPTTFRYTVDTTNTSQRFIIPHENVDIATLEIYSQNPSLTETTAFSYYKDISVADTDGTTPIYFIFENELGEYEISFGDGSYGYSPVNGEIIYITYLIVNNESANGANRFTASNTIYLSGNLITDATVTVTANDRTSGGADREDDESIRFYAPKYYLTQGNAITQDDYEVIIKQDNSNIEAVNTWGGEENNPPKYGRVFIAAKPFGALYLTDLQKDNLELTIKQKMPTAIRPEVVDPKYTYMEIGARIRYDSERTLKSGADLQREMNVAIADYADVHFNVFQYEFILNDFITYLNGFSDSFLSVQIDIELKKLFQPTLNVGRSYTFYYQNEIFYPYTGYIDSISSSEFTYAGTANCFLKQTSTGSLNIVAVVNDIETTIAFNVGEVDYKNGIIVLRNFAPQLYENSYISLNIVPNIKDVSFKREFLLKLLDSDIDVSMIDINGLDTSQSDNPTVDVSSTAF